MKASRLVVVAGVSAAMIAAGWRAGLAPVPSVTLSDPTAGSTIPRVTTPTPGVSPTQGSVSSSTTGVSSPTSPSGIFVGSAVDTAYGTMQVQVVVTDGVLVDIQPLIIGLGDPTSSRINADAIPTLETRVLSAQSANVDYVSGASYTSQGYLASVADAMSNAGI